MTAKSRMAAALIAAFSLGIMLPAILILNPGDWDWADSLIHSRAHSQTEAGSSETARLWTCGMHPQVVQDQPGNCPICQMRLLPVKDTGPGTALRTPDSGLTRGAQPERKVSYWRAPMDPSYVSDQPGKSPMGMDLVPVYEDEAPSAGGVRVDPNFVQNFGVRTAVAEKGGVPIEIRTVGVLAHDEKNVVSVNTKFEGWIEKAYFNNVGEHVRRGALLFEIYSPQLITTQKEYLAAMEYLESLESSGYSDAIDRARSLLDSARERLRFWDVSGEQIARIERGGETMRTIRVYSPASGHIAMKMSDSLEGMKVTPGMTIFKLADHTRLWAEVEFFEHQTRYLRQGQSVTIEAAAFPGRKWRGKISFFRPALDPRTRTLKAFVEIPNKDLQLRPQMFVNVVYRHGSARGAVKVPAEAVLHSGERSVVIVQREKGLFELREVRLGSSGAGFQEILRGVAPGEVVVTSSQFLIASESNLRAAITQMLGNRTQEAVTPPAAQQR